MGLEELLARRAATVERIRAACENAVTAERDLTPAEWGRLRQMQEDVAELDQLLAMGWQPARLPTPVQRARRVLRSDPLRSALTDGDLEWLLAMGWQPEARTWITSEQVRQ